jgi:hypothetical protein
MGSDDVLSAMGKVLAALFLVLNRTNDISKLEGGH